MSNSIVGVFDGIKIHTNEFMDDDMMYVSPNTFDKIQDWINDNIPTVPISEKETQERMFNCPPLCCKCHHIHKGDDPCVVNTEFNIKGIKL